MKMLTRDALYCIFRVSDFKTQISFRKTCKECYRNFHILEIPSNLHPNLTNDILKNFPFLKRLDLSNNTNVTFEGLKHVPRLRELDVSKNELIKPEDLKHVRHLTALIAAQRSFVTSKCLKYVRHLRVLYICSNPMFRVSSRDFKYIKKLKCLFVSGKCTRIEGKDLKNFPDLIHLSALHNPRIKEDILKELKSLKTLASTVVSLEVLKSLPNLTTLYSPNITQEDAQKILPKLKIIPKI